VEDTYLITGAGSGIGRAVAVNMARGGARCLLLGRTKSRLVETREALPAPLEGEHLVVACDVRDREALAGTLRGALGEEPLRGVVAAAGVGGPNAYGPEDRWDEVVGINLTGAYNTVGATLPYLRRGPGYRHVVLVGSVLSRLGVPGYSAYCAAKAEMNGLMRSLAAELAAEKILVNTLAPGWVETEMAEEGIEGFAAATGKTYEEARAAQLRQVPLGKMSTPAEIAGVIEFLVSGAQTSITGQVLDINNGAVMAP